jgi:hypothetical protein
MKRKRITLLGVWVLVAAGGCAMCDNSWDEAYNAYGGAMPRHDRYCGRVGSILSDPQMQVSEPGGTSTAPTEADLYPEGLLQGTLPER